MKQWLIFGFVLMLLPFASGLLISPAVVEVEYGEEAKFNLTIINDISQDIVVQVSFESYEGKIDYTEYFEIENYETNKVEVGAGESETISINMEFPELEKFGDVRFGVIKFYQVPLAVSDMAATVAVLIPIETNIPYPETYVKVELEEPGVVRKGDEVLFSAVLTHLGKSVINEVTGNFVLNGNGVIDEVAISPLDLFLPSESQTVQAGYNTLELEPGKYNLSLSLEYDGESKESDAVKLIVGEEAVEILDFNPKALNTNVNTVTFTLFSLWVEDLEVDLNMDLLENENIVRSFEFGSYTLPVNEEKIISSGLDLNGIEDGNYVVRVKAEAGEEIVTKDFEVTLTSDEIKSYAPEEKNNWMWYISVGLILIAVILFVIYIIKRRKDEENYMGRSS